MSQREGASLLNEETVIPYLFKRGVIKRDSQVESFSGGISSVVLGIRNEDQDIVLKQALPELKTIINWPADQRRTLTEARAIKLLGVLTPKSVPKLIDVDLKEMTLCMERAPRDYLVWKDELLKGNIEPTVGSQLGEILAIWHNFGAETKGIPDQFQESDVFEQLRVWPFYRVTEERNPQFKVKISQLIAEITELKLTLVHGDFSPKNILVTNGRTPIVLDFEVMNFGNPVFDLAFLLAHLLCKQRRTDEVAKKDQLRRTALDFMTAYSQRYRGQIATSLPHHVALIALARVDGVSLVNYLNDSKQSEVRLVANRVLGSESPDLQELFH